MKTKIGINGFGRIGRNTLKAILKKYGGELEVAAVNDLTEPATLVHLLKYDSIYGRYDAEVRAGAAVLTVDGHKIRVFSERNPEDIRWRDAGVDIVLEATGRFNDRARAEAHLTSGGAKKVLITAPAIGEDLTAVPGVNEQEYDNKKHRVLSAASCTTNALAPLLRILHREFGIVKGFMTTVHSYTNDQNLLDLPHRDLRRARAAAMSIIPTKTGAAKAIGLVLPELDGKMDGCSLRVPTPAVSAVDLTVEIRSAVTKDLVNEALKSAADGPLKGILGYSEESLVSVDYRGAEESSVVDAPSTMVMDNMVKVLSWYDNEWGFSHRCADLLAYMAARLERGDL